MKQQQLLLIARLSNNQPCVDYLFIYTHTPLLYITYRVRIKLFQFLKSSLLHLNHSQIDKQENIRCVN